MRADSLARAPEHPLPSLPPSAPHDAPISGLDDLLEPFERGIKPVSQFRVGTEAEKPGVLEESGLPLPWEGPRSVKRVLAALVEQFGWLPERETIGGEAIALRRGQASITLEPGGQLELSGAPLATIQEIEHEVEEHLRELEGISRELGIAWLGIGFHPFARQQDLPMVPKLRYGVMVRYLPTRGKRALDMMRRTSTVQANLDFSSEDDAIRKLRVGLALQPIVMAMFANSPFYEDAVSRETSVRAGVWSDVDRDRTGYLPFVFEEDMSFRRYVEWALDVPMFLFKRDGKVVENTGQTFRAFMKDGFGGYRAKQSDWTSHINTIFPEARLKHTIEMRGADAQSRALVPALPAIWKGILYDDAALRRAEELSSKIDPTRLEEERLGIAERGLRATFQGRPMGDWAELVLDIADAGLGAQRIRNPHHEDERRYLAPLRALLLDRESPGHRLARELEGVTDRDAFRKRVIELTKL